MNATDRSVEALDQQRSGRKNSRFRDRERRQGDRGELPARELHGPALGDGPLQTQSGITEPALAGGEPKCVPVWMVEPPCAPHAFITRARPMHAEDRRDATEALAQADHVRDHAGVVTASWSDCRCRTRRTPSQPRARFSSAATSCSRAVCSLRSVSELQAERGADVELRGLDDDDATTGFAERGVLEARCLRVRTDDEIA